MNERDSETISGILNSYSLKNASSYEEADILILNTCSVRENADNKVIGILGILKSIEKSKRPIVIVSGCISGIKKTKEDLIKKFNFIDLFIKPQEFDLLKNYLDSLLIQKENEHKQIEVLESEVDEFNYYPSKRMFKHKGYINIMKGCNNFCTYCIVPYARGREISRDPNEIIKEAESLIKDNVKEITLLGQNVNSYKKIMPNNEVIDFADLLEKLLELDIKRLRYMTSNPKDINDKVISLHKKYGNLMPSLHLPIQSASNKVLKDMNRGYKKEDFINICKKFRELNEDFYLSTDFLIAFPTETYDDFIENIKLLEKVNLDFAFTFIYSKREGTKAAELKSNIKKEEIAKRFEELKTKLSETIYKRNEQRIGKTYEILVDEKKSNGFSKGRTKNNLVVFFKSKNIKIGEFINVKITNAKPFFLEGVVID